MSDMKPMLVYITLGSKEYPLQFTVNAMDDIQEHFNVPIDRLTDLMQDEKDRFRNLRYLLTLLINEGLDCEGDETGEYKAHVDERFIGRQINATNAVSVMQSIYSAFSGTIPQPEDDEENPQTGQ